MDNVVPFSRKTRGTGFITTLRSTTHELLQPDRTKPTVSGGETIHTPGYANGNLVIAHLANIDEMT